VDDGEGGRWLEPPLLPRLPDPPYDRVMVRGASLMRVYSPAGAKIEGRDGGRAAIVVAWARLGDGRGWGVLMAWAGNWQGADHRATARPRWGWVRLDAERVKPVKPRPEREGSEIEWFGSWPGCALDEAMYHAAVELPKERREAAVTPRPWVDG
jgi:hypothetical protein